MSFVDVVPPPSVATPGASLRRLGHADRTGAVFGIRFSLARADEIVRELVEHPVPAGQGLRTVITANLDHVVKLRRNARFRAAYDAAWKVTVDGAPVQLYARLRGVPVSERVTGADLLPKLLDRLDAEHHRLFLVLGSEETAQGVLAYLRRADIRVPVEYVVVPPGFGTDPAYNTALAARICGSETTHLFMGVGAPKSEIWMFEHRQQLGDCYGMAFGAAFDFIAGTRRRAPEPMRRLGLEWSWRLMSEPRRLARRYLFDSWGFVSAMVEDMTGRTAR